MKLLPPRGGFTEGIIILERDEPEGATEGLGDAGILPADPLTQSASDLIAWLSANACTQNAVTQVSDFQTAWNTSNLGPALTVDGKYGPLTRGALQSVMNAIGTGTAPPDCFTPTAATTTPSTTTTANPAAAPAPMMGYRHGTASTASLLIGGAIIAGAAVVAYTYLERHRSRRYA